MLGQGRGTDPHSDSVSKPLEPDYDVSRKDGEHAEDALHRGSWDWHSYILNGVKNDVFKERCPKTAAVVDDVRPRVICSLSKEVCPSWPFLTKWSIPSLPIRKRLLLSGDLRGFCYLNGSVP